MLPQQPSLYLFLPEHEQHVVESPYVCANSGQWCGVHGETTVGTSPYEEFCLECYHVHVR